MENIQTEPKFIVAVGASAGGLNAVLELTAQLKPEMNVAVFIVLHITKMSLTDVLVSRLQSLTSYTCKLAEDGEPIKSQHVYLAPPDLHLLLAKGSIILGQGPAENRWRPSIDMLFRSAAAAYNSRLIGIILTGLMQDGTAGMDAIRRSGGTLIVQDPKEAEYPDMPLSVLQNMDVDYSISVSKMGALLSEKTRNGLPPQKEVPHDIAVEAELSRKVAISIDALAEVGKHSPFSCPDCGGHLYFVNSENIEHYKCHVGHSYTEGELLFQMTNSLEATLWVALRMMEERRLLLEKMSREERGKGWMHSAEQKQVRSAEMRTHIERLKELLFATKTPASAPF
jgi:two-component system, chemotaxis family, protein-glutamate methylesterase/glutaminase